MSRDVVDPAETDTEVRATSNSVWYSTMVYVPGFMRGDVKAPEDEAYTQYCAASLNQ